MVRTLRARISARWISPAPARSEGDGISRLVLEQCDHIVSIPMKNPEMESLNASVAAGILMYAAAAGRE